MSREGKQFYSKAETRARLQVGRRRYAQLIESKILPQPIEIIAGARPVHTTGQIEIAESNLYRRALKDLQPSGGRKMKPLSQKLMSEIS